MIFSNLNEIHCVYTVKGAKSPLKISFKFL